MPDLTLLFRLARPARSLPLLAVFALAGLAAPAAAEDAALPYDLPAISDTTLATGDDEQATAHFQNTEIDENILLPPARPQDDDPERKWSRDYFAVAVGVLNTPKYNGSDDRRTLPAFYFRGRVSGFSFSTRGTNLVVDLIRQRRGQKTDFKFGPSISLRGDRSGKIDDPQVAALGKRKVAVELGLFAGVTQTGVLTSKYDQLGFRMSASKDVSGRHGSWTASPTIDYGTPLSKRAYIGVSASVNFYGKGFGRYYYDIDAEDSAASGLPVYDGAGRKATAGKYTLGIAGAYSLSGDLRKGFTLIGGAQYGRIASRFAKSPIVADVGSADQWLFGGGLAYQF
ncbi:MipA/OmpV family protein [Sphingopyxis sp.]|uniref:MipA/OmpV family protein n=1 Tax=Sphingopyxis sp. TaxID=1908224 RepID=UPI002D76C595|nr:MipA/OmpV family protein [Sphingopyxis sp.]HET6523435.1 MipA/OmpV family protein [Sphingopyxis sp.]